MVRTQVSVNFESADRADAEEKIKSWTLHEGCTLYISVSEDVPPQETDAEGKVTEVQVQPLSVPPPELEPPA